MCFPQSLLASWTDLHPSIYRTLWIPHGVTRLLELPQLPVGKGGVHPAQVDRLLHSLSISGCKKRSKKPLWLIWKCSACLPLYCAAFVKQSNQCDRIQMSFISTVSFFINKENYHKWQRNTTPTNFINPDPLGSTDLPCAGRSTHSNLLLEQLISAENVSLLENFWSPRTLFTGSVLW